MMTIIVSKILLYFVSLALLAYFSGAETALASLSTLSLNALKDKYPAMRKAITLWEDNPSEILATVIVGSTVAIIGSGIIATSLAIDVSQRMWLSRKAAFLTIPVAGAFLTLVFGEIMPKIVSRFRAERVAVASLPMLMRFNAMIAPFNHVLLTISEWLIGMLRRRAVREAPFLRPDELKILLLSDESLPLPVPARRIMENILDFGTTRINQVMIPRAQVQAVDLNQEQEKIIDQIIEKGYSRVPVYRGNLDNIAGIIYSKDLAFAWRGGSLFVIADLIRPAYFVPGAARTDKVLRDFKSGHQHMAIVVDEYGSTIGVVTIEDLVEEIVGDIWDEYDIQKKTIIPFPDGSYLVRAAESIDTLNSQLNLSLPAGEFNTVGGWALDMFGRIPKIGDSVRWGDLEIEIVDADKTKIQRIKIKKR